MPSTLDTVIRKAKFVRDTRGDFSALFEVFLRLAMGASLADTEEFSKIGAKSRMSLPPDQVLDNEVYI
jgi:hypothetical protein